MLVERFVKVIVLIFFFSSLILWVIFSYRWIVFEPSAEAVLLPVTATLGLALSFLGWTRSRAHSNLVGRPSIDTLISQKAPVSLLNWYGRVYQAKQITRQYAKKHMQKNTLIKFGGDLFDLTTGTFLLGDLASRGIALNQSIKLFKSLSQEVAGVFLADPDSLKNLHAINFSLMQEISDLLIDDFGVEMLIEYMSEEVAENALSWAELVPLLRLISSSAFAYAYTWVISLATVIYLLNNNHLINDQKKETFKESKNLLRTKFYTVGPVRLFPKKIEEPNWDDIFSEVDVVRDKNIELLLSLLSEIRKHYPHLTQTETKNIFIEKGMPRLLVEIVLSDENWLKAEPTQPTMPESVFALMKDFITI